MVTENFVKKMPFYCSSCYYYNLNLSKTCNYHNLLIFLQYIVLYLDFI
jgi:hypothetical protein